MKPILSAISAFGVLCFFYGLTSSPAGTRSEVAHRFHRLALDSGFRRLSGSRIVAMTAAAAVLTFVVVAGLTRSLVVSLAIAGCALCLPSAYLRSRVRKRRARFREAWPDAIANLISGVRAGISLAEACVSLSERGPEELRSQFKAYTATYRASGSFRVALERLKSELADPIGDRVVAALVLAHDVGGTDLVQVLRTLGDFVSADLRLRKEIEARWSWTVTAARVAAAAPWLVLLVMSMRPEAAAAYNSTTGLVVVAAGAAATLVGYRLMLRAARLPDEKRLYTG